MIRDFVVLFALCGSSLSADVTVRYQSEMKSSIPAVTEQVTAKLKSAMPASSTVRVKGSKSFTEYGTLSSINDAGLKQVTVLDSAGKKYAVTNLEDYQRSISGAMPTLPPEAAGIMASFKTKADTRATGRTATILGVEAEEREVVFSVDGPAMPNMPPGPMMRMVMQIWMSKESEAARLPALRELAASMKTAMSGTSNPLAGLQKMLGTLPGLGEGLGAVMQEMIKPNAVMMRIHVDLYMPILATVMKQMPAGANPLGADFDPNAPFMEINQELVELSTATLPDSLFLVPDGYQQMPIDQFMKDYMARFAVPGAEK